MKTKAIFFFLLSSIIILTGCQKKIQEISLTIVVLDKLGNNHTDLYPELLQKIVVPIKTNAKNSKFNYVFKPLIIKRLGGYSDVEIEIQSTNKKNINTWINFTTKYFQENFIGKQFSSDNNTDFNKTQALVDYLRSTGKKDKIFYYSDKSRDDKFNNEILFSNYDSLRLSIINYLNENSNSNIVIILNPEEKIINDTQTETVTNETSPIVTTPSSNSNTEELRNWLLKIVNTKATPSERRNIADKLYREILSENFYARIYRDSPASEPTYYPKGSGKAYLDNLTTEESITDFTNIKVTRSNEKNKIDYIELVEKHNQ